MGKIWFIRHGQASFGTQEYDALSGTGFRQAQAVGEFMAATGQVFDAVYSGSLKRQLDTAAQAMAVSPASFQSHEPVILPEFNEYDFVSISKGLLPVIIAGDPAVREKSRRFFSDDTVFVELFSRIFIQWLSGYHDVPGIETFVQYRTRILSGVETVISQTCPEAHVAVFTSGGVIATLLQHVLGLSQKTTMETGWQILNASMTCFDITKGYPVLSSFNTTAHLELVGQDLLTFR
ncbi:MAG: histidine phosphatase family protein [Pseudomonadota bacterium]